MTIKFRMDKAARQEHVLWPAYNDAVGTVAETIWGQGGRFDFNVMPGDGVTGQGLRVVSASANDTAGGTGANALLLYGVREGEVEQQELIIPNGITPVVSSYTDWIWVSQLIVASAGNGANLMAANAGTISVLINGGANDGVNVCGIFQGNNRSTKGVYRVPANRQLYLEAIDAGVVGNNGRATVEVWIQETAGGVFYKRSTFEAINQQVTEKLGIRVKPKCCIELTAKTASGTQSVGAALNMYFYNEDQLEKLGLA